MGLGYVNGVNGADVQALVAARASGGPFASLGDLAAHEPARGARRWSSSRGRAPATSWPESRSAAPFGGGWRDARAGRVRREALWQLGVATPGRRTGAGGTPGRSSRCRWTCPRRRALRRSGAGSG